MSKPWYQAPKVNGWPEWVPWLETPNLCSTDLWDWLFAVFPPRRVAMVMDKLRSLIDDGSILRYIATHTPAQQAAMWKRLCRELDYTEVFKL